MPAPDDARRTAISIIAPTAERHGLAVVDADELEQLRLERHTLLAALEVMVGEPTAADRAKALALVAELTAADSDA